MDDEVYPGTLTRGTRHRRGKGATARLGLVEAIGVQDSRTHSEAPLRRAAWVSRQAAVTPDTCGNAERKGDGRLAEFTRLTQGDLVGSAWPRRYGTRKWPEDTSVQRGRKGWSLPHAEGRHSGKPADERTTAHVPPEVGSPHMTSRPCNGAPTPSGRARGRAERGGQATHAKGRRMSLFPPKSSRGLAPRPRRPIADGLGEGE